MEHLIPYLVGFSVVVIFKTLHAQVSDSIIKWSVKDVFQHNLEAHDLTSQKYFNFENASYIIIKSLK